MAELELSVAGRTHRIACRDGEEPELRAAAALLDEQAALVAGLGGGEARVLLLAGLLVADRLRERDHGPAAASAPSPAPSPDRALVQRLAGLAERAEALADRLEARDSSPAA